MSKQKKIARRAAEAQRGRWIVVFAYCLLPVARSHGLEARVTQSHGLEARVTESHGLEARVTEQAMADINDGNHRGVALSRELTALYGQFAQRINADLAAAIARTQSDPEAAGPQFRAMRAAELSRIIQARLNKLAAASQAVLPAALSKAVQGARAAAERELKALGLDSPPAGLPGLAPNFFAIDEGSIEVVAQDTAARMLAGAGQHGQRALALFRSLSAGPLYGPQRERAVNRAIAQGIAGGKPDAAMHMLRDLFADRNAPEVESYRKLGHQLIEVGRAVLSVRDYTEIVVITRTREATETARHTRLAEAGVDLVQITGRNTGNFCTRFVGLVCTLGPARDGYPALSALPGGGPPFHPRCSKSTAAYVEEVAGAGRKAEHRKALRRYEAARRNGMLRSALG